MVTPVPAPVVAAPAAAVSPPVASPAPVIEPLEGAGSIAVPAAPPALPAGAGIVETAAAPQPAAPPAPPPPAAAPVIPLPSAIER